MRDCKIISLRINAYFSMREVKKKTAGNQELTVYDNPAMEAEINAYLRQGYRIVSMMRIDHTLQTFVLEREI